MDLEARLHGAAPSEHPEALRLWLRLLTCTQLIEKQVRSHLRAQFDTTLPRFDLMAQLERAPQGREQFNTMARQHEQWIVEAFASLGERDIATLYRLLGKVKEHTQNNSLETAE